MSITIILFQILVWCIWLLIKYLSNVRDTRSKRPPIAPQLHPDVDKLRRQLVRMLVGNRVLAEKLVQVIREKNPGQDEIWYWEKAISDLEKDRR